MKKILHIQASPRDERSASTTVARHFIEAFCKLNPEVIVETLDLWENALPEFHNEMIEAKYAILHRQTHTAAQQEAWEQVAQIVQHFMSADYYLFSVPLWNLSVPYKLKHYLDILVQPGLTFAYTADGFKGLVQGKKGVGIYARGSHYPRDGSSPPHDHQVTLMRDLLGFIGLTDLREVVVAPTAMVPNAWEEAVTASKPKVEELARRFEFS